MAQNLQGRVQLLGILISVFILLSLPLFAQVRADAASSAERGDDTVMGRWIGDLVKAIKGDTNDIEVEDAYGKWKEQNPDCTGAQCGPDGDLDGDGMSNQEELEKGRNPECDEAKQGYDYCQGQMPTSTPTGPTTSPTPTDVPALNNVIFSKTGIHLSFTSDRFSEPKMVDKQTPDYDKWVVSWDVRDYVGAGSYRIIILNQSNIEMMNEQYQLTGARSSDLGKSFDVVVNKRKSGETFTFKIQLDSGTNVDGTWDLTVTGKREKRIV